MSEQKWVRSSLRQLSTRLGDAGHPVSPPSVGRLLADLDYALHVNAKKLEARSDHADRDAQFSYSAATRQAFVDAALPIISVDTKKKELIGNFRNPGRAWCTHKERLSGALVPSNPGFCRATGAGVMVGPGSKPRLQMSSGWYPERIFVPL